MSQLPGAHPAPDAGIERRIGFAVLLILAVWAGLVGRLFYLQVLEGDRYRISAQRNSVRTHRLIAPRGVIFDRNGKILVDSRPSFDVLLVPHETPDSQMVLGRLSALTGEPIEELVERVGSPRGRARFRPQPVARDLGRDAHARVAARLWALPGVLTQVAPIRDYRFGADAAHVLGRLGEVSADELAKRAFQGYRRGDVIGKDGVERLLDREMRGRDGGANVLVDAHGRELERLDAVEPAPGDNVVLTLDQELQHIAERAFDEIGKRGAVVALDPRNGEVLALMSRPAYNPNDFSHGIATEDWAALRNDPLKPLHDRALQGVYPPGSTYKVVTALAGLETGAITPGYTVKCAGSYRLGRRRYRCWKLSGHGVVDLHRAIVQSCDVFFYTVGHEVGVDQLGYYARLLGLGSRPGIDIGREASGLVPTRAWKERRFKEKWLKGETISLSIGQGFNLWTPIQMAVAYGAIANGGTRYRPFVVKRLQDPEGVIKLETKPQAVATVAVSEESLAAVRHALRGVVHDPHGTGYAMRGMSVEAAGKTGTAQVVSMGKEKPAKDEEIPEALRDHAWFATYAPADDPRIVVAVLVEHGGHGGSAAAPIARKIVEAYLERRSIEGVEVVEGAEGSLHARH